MSPASRTLAGQPGAPPVLVGGRDQREGEARKPTPHLLGALALGLWVSGWTESALGSMELAGWGSRAQSDTSPSPQASLPRWPGGGRAFTDRTVCAWHVNIPLPRLQGQFSEILEAFVEHLLRPGPGMCSAEPRARGQGTASLCPVGVQPDGYRSRRSQHKISGNSITRGGRGPLTASSVSPQASRSTARMSP